MRQQYDWNWLRQEFVQGKWLTVSSFFHTKDIRSNSYTRSRTAGWRIARQGHQRLVIRRLTDQVANDEVEIKSRQIRLSRLVQLKGVERLAEMEPTTAEDARKLITDGMRLEREALESKPTSKPDEGVRRIERLPKTKFDEIISNLDYTGILGLLAEVKRERSIRAGLLTTT